MLTTLIRDRDKSLWRLHLLLHYVTHTEAAANGALGRHGALGSRRMAHSAVFEPRLLAKRSGGRWEITRICKNHIQLKISDLGHLWCIPVALILMLISYSQVGFYADNRLPAPNFH
jgi:hypothetical protein